MRKPEALNKIKELLKLPSFSASDARKAGVSHNLLNWYVRKGDLIKIGRGIYYPTNSEITGAFKHEELIRLMTSLEGRAVICLKSALDLYGLTEEFIQVHTLAIPNTMRARKIANVHFIRMRDMETGRTTINLGGYDLPIFDQERTLVDSFRLLSIETALKALKIAFKNGNTIDLNKISKYAELLHVNITPYILSLTT